ncbi:tryptophan 7-halogenase [Sinorhizobium sp. 8-89]|uniref:tryptophan 7-halogenase n=1 Tax=Sinorhizobium sp. 7-81 TaxID=3049087 RepID=UPI0024C2197E|nr:tryptophan 7-halogenase [Sinorhizobium sp. 7-81]MDK1389269.1 tryptophan 7-halogenase [Sinorhizobium sp. 7-81]
MTAGWIWEVQLNRTTRAGYLFSSRHADTGMAMAKAEQRFGHRLQPKHELSFYQGYFETARVNNLVALGTASGFVEPLQAALAAHLRAVEEFGMHSR